MTNYICINGKKAELTEEQMRALGIELPKAKSNPFERVDYNHNYYLIDNLGEVVEDTDWNYEEDQKLFNAANYCTDKAIMEQRALHEILNRLLWRYSMEHDGDKIDWNNNEYKYYIYYSRYNERWAISSSDEWDSVTYFYTEEIAENAIEEIVKPFMKAHPDFKF